MTELATITSLGFSIFSTYNGRGVNSARRDINDLSNDLEKNRAKLGASVGGFLSLQNAAISLAPALIPIGTVALGVGVAVSTMAVASGVALGAYGFAMRGAITDTLKMAKAHKELSPVQQTFINNVHAMKAAMNGVSTGTMNLTLHTATIITQGLTSVIKGMTPVIKAVAPVVDEVANAFKKWAAGDGLKSFVQIIVKSGVPALHNLFDAARSVLGFLGDGFRALQPTIIPVSKAIADGAADLKKWGDNGGFANWLTKIHNMAPSVGEFFSVLGQALRNVSVAMAGLGPLALNLATTLLRIVAALPPSVIQAMVVAYEAWKVAAIAAALSTWLLADSQIALAAGLAISRIGAIGMVAVAVAQAVASGIATVATIAWSAAVWLLNAALAVLLSPITLVILAVAALGVGVFFLVTNWNTAWNAMKNTALTVWAFLSQGLGQLALLLLGPIGILVLLGLQWHAIWTGMQLIAQTVWTALQIGWNGFVAGMVLIWNTSSAALSATWTAVWNGMGTAARVIWTALGVAWNGFVTGMTAIWNAMSAALVASWNAVWNGMGVAGRAVWTGMETAWQAVLNAMHAAWSGFTAIIGAAWNGFWAALHTAGQAVWSAMAAAWQGALNVMHAAWSGFTAIIGAAWSGFWNTTQAVGIAIWAGIQGAWQTMLNVMHAAWSGFTGIIGAAWSGFWNAIKSAGISLWAGIQGAWQTMLNVMHSAWSGFTGIIGAAWNGFWNSLRNSFNAFSSGIQSATKALFNAMVNAWRAGAVAIGAAWSSIKKLTRDPIQAVVNVVYNNGIVKLWNMVAGVFGAPKLGSFSLPNFATGGPIRGAGNGTSDSIVARVSNGEHVWTAKEVDAAGGHDAVLGMRAGVMGHGYKPAKQGDGMGGFALGGIIPSPGDILGGIGDFFSNAFKVVDGVASAAFNVATGFGGDIIAHLKDLALGGVSGIVNPLIQKAANVGKDAVKGLIPGSPWIEQLIAGGAKQGVVSTGGPNPQDTSGATQGGLPNNGGGFIQKMADAIKDYITSHDIPVGGANVADAQKWADAQIGKPYSLGGNFGASFDCSQFMSGIAQVILGNKPSPLFTTFAFTGAKQGPATFEKDLEAPFMVGVENRGVGHMAGTLNGKNYEATPPAVRSGPGALGAKSSFFDMVYGMKASMGGGQGVIPVGEHLAIIDAALAAAGVPPPGTKAQWEAGMNTLITRESAWNSSAINLTDSNAAAGHPSQGLAQTIPSTFAAYHVAGTSNNILDPIANVAAAIRYIVARYGNITNVQQANASLPPMGYSMGTDRAKRGWHMIDENGGEWINFRGGEKVLPHGRTPKTGGGTPVVVNVTNHWPEGTTKETVQYAEGGMAEKLRQACAAGVGGRPH